MLTVVCTNRRLLIVCSGNEYLTLFGWAVNPNSEGRDLLDGEAVVANSEEISLENPDSGKE